MSGADSFDLDEVLGYLIVRVAETLEQSFTEVVATEGLTVRQFGILALLAEAGVKTAADLARRLNVTAQSVGPQIDALVRRGLVARDPNPGRGRRIGIWLTDAGRATFGRAARLAFGEQERTTGHLGPEERAHLADQLREIARRASAPRA